MELKGSKTEANLRSAISGEAQAAVLYEFFAKRAKKDGFEEVADIFWETSENEKAHAEIYWKLLSCIGTTDQNLFSAVASEKHENSVMYPSFAQIARDEGFAEIAKIFEEVGKIESAHENRFQKKALEIQNGAVFSKGMETEWICLNCGHRHKGANAPEICEVCSHPKAYFKEIKSE
jgi:rubrerythrin